MGGGDSENDNGDMNDDAHGESEEGKEESERLKLRLQRKYANSIHAPSKTQTLTSSFSPLIAAGGVVGLIAALGVAGAARRRGNARAVTIDDWELRADCEEGLVSPTNRGLEGLE